MRLPLFALLLLAPSVALAQCAGGVCGRPARLWTMDYVYNGPPVAYALAPVPGLPGVSQAIVPSYRPIRPGAAYRPVPPQIRYESYYSPAQPVYAWWWTPRGWRLVRVR